MARPATLGDAVGAVEAVRRSIESCTADHQNDPATLARWLANKQPDTFKRWLADPENFCVVEEVGGKVEGVGLLRRDGKLLLFYVAPEHQRSGLGRRIHAALEARATALHVSRLHLESTLAARDFYAALGYASDGPARPLFGVLQGYPYAKPLPPP
ncbi:MAG: GNAT family N-acetyltransferase [Rhodanobacteraceae bacterium]